MSKWRVVPAEPTPEQLQAMAMELPDLQNTYGAFMLVKAQHAAMLAAAPAFEPDDAMVERARYAYEANIGYYSAMRAALKAAFASEAKP